MMEYIYLLQEREFIKTKENIYKLGKTKQENLKRIQNYSNGTKLIIQLECENCDITEKALIIIFKQKFIQRIDIGTKSFEGDKYEMCKIICDYIVNFEQNHSNINTFSSYIVNFEQNHSNINTFSSYKTIICIEIIICLAIIIYNFRYSTKEIIAYSFDINYYIFCKNILNNIFNLMLKIITNKITF